MSVFFKLISKKKFEEGGGGGGGSVVVVVGISIAPSIVHPFGLFCCRKGCLVKGPMGPMTLVLQYLLRPLPRAGRRGFMSVGSNAQPLDDGGQSLILVPLPFELSHQRGQVLLCVSAANRRTLLAFVIIYLEMAIINLPAPTICCTEYLAGSKGLPLFLFVVDVDAGAADAAEEKAEWTSTFNSATPPLDRISNTCV